MIRYMPFYQQHFSGLRPIFLIGILIGVFFYLMNLGSTIPIIQPDEGMNFSIGSVFAGYQNDAAGGYSLGYPLVLSPAFWVEGEPSEVWQRIKLINAVLVVFFFVGLERLALRLKPDSFTGERIFAAGLVTLYPAWITLTGSAFSQIALAPTVVWAGVLLISSFKAGGLLPPFLLGCLTGFASWLHPTGIMVLVGITVAVTLAMIVQRTWLRLGAFCMAVGFTLVIESIVIEPWVLQQMSLSGLPVNSHYGNSARILGPLMEPESFLRVVSALGGHVFYLVAGSMGLAFVGVAVASHRLVSSAMEKERPFIEGINVFWLAMGFTLFATLLISVLNIYSVDMVHRLDHHIYGRYTESYISPFLLAGVLFRPRWALWLSIPVALVAGLIAYSVFLFFGGAAAARIGQYKKWGRCRIKKWAV